jgi:ketosteroid isomerase-like protein
VNDTKDMLLRFFEAENRRDWAEYGKYLAPDVVWELFSGQETTVRGIDRYIAAIKKAYDGSDDTFVCEAMYHNGDGNRIVTILKNSHGQRSCDMFEIADGLIAKEYEFILD